MSSLLSRDGKFLLVLNGGYNPPSISVIATDTMKETSRVPVGDAWLGMAFSPDGKFVYLGGGGSYRVREFAYADGNLKPAREFEINPGSNARRTRFHWRRRALSRWPSDLRSGSVSRLRRRHQSAIRPRHRAFQNRPPALPDSLSSRRQIVSSFPVGPTQSVYQYDATNGSEISRVRVGPHATDMVLSDRKPDRDADSGEADNGAKYRLFVTAGNTNSVFVVGVTDNKDLKLLETLNVAMTPQEPAGMTPSGLALNSDQTRLFVACSDANAVAVADVSAPRSHLMGLIPVGWYPTAARVLADGRLLVLNGRGPGSYPTSYPSKEKKSDVLMEGGRAPGFVASFRPARFR